MSDRTVPSLYEWVGGLDALTRLTTRFYEHVKKDALLGPVFAHMDDSTRPMSLHSWAKYWVGQQRIQSSTAVIRT